MQRSALINWIALVASTILLFFLISVMHLPLPRRGMTGAGLYEFIDALRFVEVFAGTLAGVFLVASAMRLHRGVCVLASISAALINLALLIADVRMHAYSDWVESYLAETYGRPWAIWAYSGLAAVGGLVCARLAWRLQVVEPTTNPVDAPQHDADR